MTARAHIRKADVRRKAEALWDVAVARGLPVGSFEIVVEGDRVRLLPLAANSSPDDAADMAERIRRAFGGDDSASALHR